MLICIYVLNSKMPLSYTILAIILAEYIHNITE